MVIPVGIITVIFLLIAFIPLGLLVFHDYFGLGKLSIPQPFRMRMIIAIVQVLCGIGLLFVLFTLQAIYADLVVAENGLAPFFVLLVLLLVSYVTLSAFALAIGSLLSKAFRWTLKTHSITGIAVLILAPVTIMTLGTNPEILQSRTVVVRGCHYCSPDYSPARIMAGPYSPGRSRERLVLHVIGLFPACKRRPQTEKDYAGRYRNRDYHPQYPAGKGGDQS